MMPNQTRRRTMCFFIIILLFINGSSSFYLTDVKDKIIDGSSSLNATEIEDEIMNGSPSLNVTAVEDEIIDGSSSLNATVIEDEITNGSSSLNVTEIEDEIINDSSSLNVIDVKDEIINGSSLLNITKIKDEINGSSSLNTIKIDDEVIKDPSSLNVTEIEDEIFDRWSFLNDPDIEDEIIDGWLFLNDPKFEDEIINDSSSLNAIEIEDEIINSSSSLSVTEIEDEIIIGSSLNATEIEDEIINGSSSLNTTEIEDKIINDSSSFNVTDVEEEIIDGSSLLNATEIKDEIINGSSSLNAIEIEDEIIKDPSSLNVTETEDEIFDRWSFLNDPDIEDEIIDGWSFLNDPEFEDEIIDGSSSLNDPEVEGEVFNGDDNVTSMAVNITNSLSFFLYRNLLETDNMIFSPFGVSSTLAMVYLGTEEESRKEFEEVLGFNGDIHRGLTPFVSLKTNGSDDSSYSLIRASAVAIQKKCVISLQYLYELATRYKTLMLQFDPSIEPHFIVESINNWVNVATNGKIPSIINKAPSSSTPIMLLSSILFQAPWKHEFDKKKTTAETFYNYGYQPSSVKMMHQKIKVLFGYHPKIDSYLLALPYGGLDADMLFLLPREHDGLPTLESNLSLNVFNELNDSMYLTEVEIAVPKFRLEKRYGLKEVLRSVGIRSIFTEDADLSSISLSKPLFVSEVVHQCSMEIAEKGTEATAVTVVSVQTLSLKPVFYVNHPFVFFVRHKPTGMILFTGRVLHL